MKKGIFLLVFVIWFSFIYWAFAYEAREVDDISGEIYFEKVHELLESATKEIFIVMYIMELKKGDEKGKVYNLCEDLVKAKKRDVEVKIILEADIKKNEYTYFYLDKKGVQVYFDATKQYKHDKGIVVDRRWVVVGSTNWTEAALRYNSETTILVDSPGLAESILSRYARIETKRAQLKLEDILNISNDLVYPNGQSPKA